MDPSEIALRALETISNLKEELTEAHCRIVLREQQVAEKDRYIQELTDSLMLRVVNAHKGKSAGGSG